VRIAREQDPAPEALQLRVRGHHLHQPAAQATAAPWLEHVHVAHVGDRGEVGDDAREAHLPRALVDAEAERVAQRALEHVARDAVRPVRVREVVVDAVDVEPRRIGADREPVALPLAVLPSRGVRHQLLR